MQKRYSLLVMLLIGQTVFASDAKYQQALLQGAVIAKYGLMATDHDENKKKKKPVKDIVFEALIIRCKEKDKALFELKAENEALKQLLAERKQEQSSSSESSPCSVVAISPTNSNDVQNLSSPKLLSLATPEPNIMKSPLVSFADYPGNSRLAIPTTAWLDDGAQEECSYPLMFSDCP